MTLRLMAQPGSPVTLLRGCRGWSPVMDDVVAGGADHEGLASHACHELRPWRLWLPPLREVGEFADVVGFHLAGVLAQLTSSGLEPLDQLGAAD